MRIATARQRRGRVVAAVALVAALAAALAVALTGDAGGDEAGALAWSGPTRIAKVALLPRDRVLTGRLRNTSLRPLRLDADDVRVLDADGRTVRSAARFAAGFGHALYSPADAPDEVPARQAERLGEALTVRPGETVPVSVGWRVEPGGGQPVELRVGKAALALP